MSPKSLAFTALALAGLGLQAQAPQFGFQVGAVGPINDTLKAGSNSSVGYLIGGQVAWEWQKGQMIRARLDYSTLPYHTIVYPKYEAKYNATSFGGGVDYLYFVNGKAEGFFLEGGLLLNTWRAEYTYSGGVTGGETFNKTSLGFSGGIGWQFSRMFGVEARYVYSKIDTKTTTDNAASTVNLEATLRF